MERAVTALAHHVTSLGADVTNAVDLETADNNPLQRSRAQMAGGEPLSFAVRWLTFKEDELY